jgi:hypothetical protein
VLAEISLAKNQLLSPSEYERSARHSAGPLITELWRETALERRVLRHLWVTDDENLGRRAREHRVRTIEHVLGIFRGRGIVRETTGNSPGTEWTAFNAIVEHLDDGRRYTARTNQAQRSFENTALKQRGLDLVVAA